jgi:hypothetical protein
VHYIIYITTNLITNQKYIGVHNQPTNQMEFDGYLGSGIILKRAIKKYGAENFKRVTLYKELSKAQAYSLEIDIVNENIVADDMYYNLKIGGSGGWEHHSKETLLKMKTLQSGILRDNRLGKLHSDYSKSLMSKKRIGKYIGKDNPNFKCYKFISPDGVEYITEISFKLFCKNHKLSSSILRKYKNKVSIPAPKYTNHTARCNSTGWSVVTYTN